MVGTVTVSLEVELAWGLMRIDGADPLDRHSPGGKRERRTLGRLLELCERLELPLSFNLVGHLLLGSCTGDHQGPHPTGWFDSDPGTNVDREPLYYGPDLVELIAETGVEHELATHTFSHARCDEVADAVVDWELTRVEELHAERGLGAVESFVPPIHAPAPREILRDHGIETVRRPVEYRPPVKQPDPPDGPLDRVLCRLRRSHPVETLLRSPTVATPTRTGGLVETYTSWHASLSAPYLRNGSALPHPAYRVLPTSLRQRRHQQYLLEGLREVAANGGAIHYWSHLFNISNDDQWPIVEAFLTMLADYRDRGAVQVKTAVLNSGL